MAKKIENKSVINNDEEILKQISELIPQAPDYWMDIVASKMGKKRTSIYYYTKGRGMRKGYPNYVLSQLTILVKKEILKKEMLIQESAKLNKKPKTGNPKNPK